MKKCAYCGEILGTPLHGRTNEHIFPAFLVNLFQEQDICFDKDRRFVDNSGITISDVCKSCNNGVLSILDSYGKEVIERYFCNSFVFSDYYKSSEVLIESELFTRWVLKIVYNSLRADRLMYFDMSEYVPYIMGKESRSEKISIFVGTHINLTAFPEDFFGFTPLQLYYSPRFFVNNPIATREDVSSCTMIVRGAEFTVSMRLANLIVLLVMWESNVSNNVKMEMQDTLRKNFRFELIEPVKELYYIRCVSSPFNTWAKSYGYLYSENVTLENIRLSEQLLNGRSLEEASKQFSEEWTTSCASEYGRILVEATEFPNNRKKQNDLRNIMNSKDQRG